MTENSASFFDRALSNKVAEAKRNVQELIDHFLAPQQKDLRERAEEAYLSVEGIHLMLHPEDRPAWLGQLLHGLKQVRDNFSNTNRVKFLQDIVSWQYPALNRHRWAPSGSSGDLGVDLDQIFESCRDACRIPELFDELIRLLEEILDSGEVDSNRKTKELKRVISTLRNSREGSYFSVLGSWNFVVSWAKNTGLETIRAMPGIGPVVKGFESTLQKTDQNLKAMHAQIHTELMKQIRNDLQQIMYESPVLPGIEFIESDPGELGVVDIEGEGEETENDG